MNDNDVALDANNYKLVDFIHSLLTLPESFRKEHWYVNMIKLGDKIHRDGEDEKYTYADNRVVLIVYNVMIKTGMSDKHTTVKDWYVLNRYVKVYADKKSDKYEELCSLVSVCLDCISRCKMYGDHVQTIKHLSSVLEQAVYKDGYMLLPQFLLDVIDSGRLSVPVENEVASKPEQVEKKEQSSDEKTVKEWQDLANLAKIMLEDKSALSKEQISEWENTLEISNMMLQN